MKDLHIIQINILRKLLFSTDLKFSELKSYSMENSQFVFHLDKLINDGYIIKLEDGYALTQKGKEFANRMDTSSEKMKLQAKVTTILCCERNINNEKQYLIYTRLKNPFYGFMGFPTHKVWFGEKIQEAAESGLIEECNLNGKSELIGIRHFHVYFNNEIVEDKIMNIFRFKEPKGEVKDIRDGKYQWIKPNEIEKQINKPLPEFYEILSMLNNKHEFFKEMDQFVESF